MFKSDPLLQDGRSIDFHDFTQITKMEYAVGNDLLAKSCLQSLDSIPTQTLKLASTLGQDPAPLGLWLSQGDHLPGQTGTPPGQGNPYSSAASRYLDATYKPTLKYFEASLSRPLLAFDNRVPITLPNAMVMTSLPSPDVPSLRLKIRSVDGSGPSCTKQTALSIPLVGVLCAPDPRAYFDYLRLPVAKDSEAERRAKVYADSYLSKTLFYDALEDYSNWSLIFAPLSDYQNPENGGFFSKPEDLVSHPYLVPIGKRILQGALTVDSIALAQIDLVSGDMLAAAIFNDLWDSTSGLPRVVDDKEGVKADARTRLANDAVYVQPNVLMIAMDQARHADAGGFDVSYDFGLSLFEQSDVDGLTYLNSLFNGKLPIETYWVPRDPKVDSLQSCSEKHDDSKCYRVPAARIADQFVPLPSALEFSSRQLVYPDWVIRLVHLRDSLAARVAEYDAVKYAARASANPLEDQRTLAKSLVEVTR